jgi:predicted phosphodiesterase
MDGVQGDKFVLLLHACIEPMKILVLSDLHLSHQSFAVVMDGARIDAQADVVVLAGDIDDGLGGFRWAREAFPDKPIVMVAGNHEFECRKCALFCIH